MEPAQEALCEQIRGLLLQHQRALERRMDDWITSQERLLQQACGCRAFPVGHPHMHENEVPTHSDAPEWPGDCQLGSDAGAAVQAQAAEREAPPAGDPECCDVDWEIREHHFGMDDRTIDDQHFPRQTTKYAMDSIERENHIPESRAWDRSDIVWSDPECGNKDEEIDGRALTVGSGCSAAASMASVERADSVRKLRAWAHGNRLHHSSSNLQEPWWLQAFMASPRVELFFSILICTNSVVIGMEVEWAARNADKPAPNAFFVVNFTYTAAFALELILRVVAQRWAFLKSSEWRWNILDTTVVLASLVETGVTLTSQVEGVATSNARILRILRAVRLSRTMRILPIFRLISPLRALVASIAATMRSLVWALILLLVIMYMFGILFTQCSIDHMQAERDAYDPALVTYWGGLEQSILTLFKAVSGGLSWHDVAAPLRDISPLLEWLMSLYIFFTLFAVLNVVTGIFCNSAMENAASDPDLVAESIVSRDRELVQRIRDLFQTVDAEETGLITICQLEAFMSKPKMKAYFAALEIDTDDAWGLFKLLDTNNTHVIDIEDFIWGCMRLRGHAKATDLSALRHENREIAKRLSKFIHFAEEQFEKLDRTLSPMMATRRHRRLQGA